MSVSQDQHNNFRKCLRQTGLVLIFSIGLTWVFWSALWLGGGLIGGDVYSYFLPQKTYLADQLQQGRFPLWNNKTGFGYPLLAESQTGLLYPFNLVFYSLFDVNTAYVTNHLVHYILTFCFAWMYCRRIALSSMASLFAALVFTYSWFPPRVCLEWAIITGLYFPASLWAVECYLQAKNSRYGLLLGLLLGLQLLAGHYNLAFITQLTLLLYVLLRIWQLSQQAVKENQSQEIREQIALPLIFVMTSVVFAYFLAAVQLLPSWELKQQSQRSTINANFNPGYGHIPPLYLTQIIAPWLWYAPDIDTDRAIQNLNYGAIASNTNKVEAHLYFGMVPLILIAIHLLTVETDNVSERNLKRIWLMLGCLALLYATGWPLVVLKYVPGFSFFQSPGRYGIVTTMGVAVWAGYAIQHLLTGKNKSIPFIIVPLIFALTIADYRLVSRLVTYATVVSEPAIQYREESEIVRILHPIEQPVRIWGPGQNMLNNLGLAQYPVYLGIGPAQYFRADLMLPTTDDDNQKRDPEFINRQIDWLRRAGITHIIRFEPLSEAHWPVKLLFQGYDRVLNPAWARSEPIYLYELLGSRGRVALLNSRAGDKVVMKNYSPNRVDIATQIPWLPNEKDRTVRLILTDLAYPGWVVYVDGKPAKVEIQEGLFRAVELQPGQCLVSWRYHPSSYRWGQFISLMAVLGFVMFGGYLFRSQRQQELS